MAIDIQATKKRFWSRVEKGPSCWIWTSTVFAHSGYGRFKSGGRDTSAHIFAYEWSKGAVPLGMELDHLCRNRRCVNPEHLEPVTHRVNILRGETIMAVNHLKMRCIRGHPLQGPNLLIKKDGRRRCWKCHKQAQLRTMSKPEQKAKHAARERKYRARRKEHAA